MRFVIIEETKNRWERRTPLTPSHVEGLVRDHGLDVAVVGSDLRIFPDDDYRRAGAAVESSVAGGQVVLGIKEPPLEQVGPGQLYMVFSHTIKGQDYNMPLLRRFLDQGASLVDYERIVDDGGRRLIAFGQIECEQLGHGLLALAADNHIHHRLTAWASEHVGLRASRGVRSAHDHHAPEVVGCVGQPFGPAARGIQSSNSDYSRSLSAKSHGELALVLTEHPVKDLDRVSPRANHSRDIEETERKIRLRQSLFHRIHADKQRADQQEIERHLASPSREVHGNCRCERGG